MIDKDDLDLRLFTVDRINFRLPDEAGTPCSIHIPTLKEIFKACAFSKDLAEAQKQIEDIDPVELMDKVQLNFYQLFPEMLEHKDILNPLMMNALIEKVLTSVIPEDVRLLEEAGVVFEDDSKKGSTVS